MTKTINSKIILNVFRMCVNTTQIKICNKMTQVDRMFIYLSKKMDLMDGFNTKKVENRVKVGG